VGRQEKDKYPSSPVGIAASSFPRSGVEAHTGISPLVPKLCSPPVRKPQFANPSSQTPVPKPQFPNPSSQTLLTPRSQTLFGNALGWQTPFAAQR